MIRYAPFAFIDKIKCKSPRIFGRGGRSDAEIYDFFGELNMPAQGLKSHRTSAMSDRMGGAK